MVREKLHVHWLVLLTGEWFAGKQGGISVISMGS